MKIRVVNPSRSFRRRARGSGHTKRRRNRRHTPKKGATLFMAHKTRRRNRSRNRTRSHRRRNPLFASSRKRVRRYRRRRNPFAGGDSLKQIGSFAIWGGAGAIASRALPQMVMSGSNTGFMGYGLNLITALLGGSLIGKFVNKDAGSKFTAGGVIGTVLRVVQDNFSSMSSTFGLSGDMGMDLGFYIQNSFPVPTAGTGPFLLNSGYAGGPMASVALPGGGVITAPAGQLPAAVAAATAAPSPSSSGDEPTRWSSRWAA